MISKLDGILFFCIYRRRAPSKSKRGWGARLSRNTGARGQGFAERMQSLVARAKGLETFAQEHALRCIYEEREMEGFKEAAEPALQGRLAWEPLSMGTLGTMAAMAGVMGAIGVMGVMAGEVIDAAGHWDRVADAFGQSRQFAEPSLLTFRVLQAKRIAAASVRLQSY